MQCVQLSLVSLEFVWVRQGLSAPDRMTHVCAYANLAVGCVTLQTTL